MLFINHNVILFFSKYLHHVCIAEIRSNICYHDTNMFFALRRVGDGDKRAEQKTSADTRGYTALVLHLELSSCLIEIIAQNNAQNRNCMDNAELKSIKNAVRHHDFRRNSAFFFYKSTDSESARNNFV